jgi:hypothetical protein
MKYVCAECGCDKWVLSQEEAQKDALLAIPLPAQPTMNLLDDSKGEIPIKEYSMFEFFKKRFKSRD